MNLPITMDDSIPQQAGPGAGAARPPDAQPGEWEQAVRQVYIAARVSEGTGSVPSHWIEFMRDKLLSHLAAPLDVEDSRERPPMTPELEEVLEFLYGAEQMDGVWWGEGPPEGKPRYWWRSKLRNAVRAAMAAASSGKEKME